ncbi:glycosyltransferase family 2 protein [Oceanobacillus sp. CF4.6]|uniref:glycosyltransferase family 2 protein n=1 Tax=Oceanobacillus sp. CF4.6 TaxID=3373080 RepID=UPI003EE609EC
MKSLVSIIVPVYNCEAYISECLDSILIQTYSNIEILIINDGSIDETEKIINKYKVTDPRIRYFFQSNSGPSEARNVGISNSTGEYVVFVDADDTIDRYYVEYLLREIIHSNTDLACCGYTDISKYGLRKWTDFDFNNTTSLHYIMEKVCKGTGGVLWGKIYKREIITRHNLRLNKKLFMSEDLVFVLQYVSYCKSFSAINNYLYYYNRLNDYSISANADITYINNLVLVCMYMEIIFEEVSFNKQETNKIINNKLQDNLLNIVEQQCKGIRKNGLKAAKENVKKVLNINYINIRIGDFSSKAIVNIPSIFLLKRNYIIATLVYGSLIIQLKRIKKLKRRQVVL